MGNFDTGVSESRVLSFREKSKIVDALLECPHIRDRDSRKTVLDSLNDQIPGIIDAIPPGNDNRTHVMGIVRTCLQHSVNRDVLDVLVDIVAYFDGEMAIPVRQLRKVLHDIFFEPQVISRELFDELMEFAAHVHIAENDLLRMYHASIPQRWPSPDLQSESEAELLTLMMRDLALAPPQANGTLPLIEFVKLVASKSRPQVPEKLRVWRTRAAQYAGVVDTDEVSPKPNVPVEQPRGTFSYLLVKIQPYYASQETSQEHEFYVRAWFLEEYKSDVDKQNYEPLATSNQRYKLGALEQLLNELVSVCTRKIIAMSRDDNLNVLMVELFLPFAYLNYPDCNIHQWMIGKGYRKALSRVWPLVVRSLERADCDEPMVLYEWKQNWNILKQQRTIAEPRFLNREHFEKEISLEGVACLAFTAVPPPIRDIRQLPSGHIFTQMLIDGTSIALWPRSDINLDEAQVQDAYKTILSGCHFSQLPETVWKKRKEEQEHLLVKHLTLFWDDPHRLPPDDEGTGPETA